jgi:hypothetical protein
VAEFAVDQRYKLYRDGALYDLQKDPDERRALSAGAMKGDAARAQQLLHSALDQFRDAWPAAIAARSMEAHALRRLTNEVFANPD